MKDLNDIEKEYESLYEETFNEAPVNLYGYTQRYVNWLYRQISWLVNERENKQIESKIGICSCCGKPSMELLAAILPDKDGKADFFPICKECHNASKKYGSWHTKEEEK